MKIIYEDNHIIVAQKPVNIPSQADKTGDEDMLTIVKKYIKEKYNKPGEVWQFENDISNLVETCCKVLSDDPLFFLINSYTTGISSKVLENILYLNIKNKKGKITSGEIGLPMTGSKLVLPCGIYGRWEK